MPSSEKDSKLEGKIMYLMSLTDRYDGITVGII